MTQTKDMSCENPSEIQLENNVDLKSLSPSHEEAKLDRAENEQPSEYEGYTIGEKFNSWPGTTTSFKLWKPFMSFFRHNGCPKDGSLKSELERVATLQAP